MENILLLFILVPFGLFLWTVVIGAGIFIYKGLKDENRKN